jgi:integrase
MHDAYVREWLRDLGKGTLGLRVHPQAFRHTLAAELLVEGWPLPYLQAQLGLQSLVALQNLYRHLDIRIPPSEEVMEIIRTRPPGIETYAP